MATVDYTSLPCDVVPSSPTPSSEPAAGPTLKGPQMHRIRTVRLQQGVSLRSAARQTGTDIRQLRLQEQESTDLRLSDLHKWQRALDVPLDELLIEPDAQLSNPVMERARMVRLMKTARAIQDRSTAPAIQRLAEMLVDQLNEVMPELDEVTPWHNYGQRRSLDEVGRVAENTMSDDLLQPTPYRD